MALFNKLNCMFIERPSLASAATLNVDFNDSVTCKSGKKIHMSDAPVFVSSTINTDLRAYFPRKYNGELFVNDPLGDFNFMSSQLFALELKLEVFEDGRTTILEYESESAQSHWLLYVLDRTLYLRLDHEYEIGVLKEGVNIVGFGAEDATLYGFLNGSQQVLNPWNPIEKRLAGKMKICPKVDADVALYNLIASNDSFFLDKDTGAKRDDVKVTMENPYASVMVHRSTTKAPANSNQWAPYTTYALGAYAEPLTPNSPLYMIAEKAGVSGGTEPVWGSDGNIVTDGSVTWKVISRTHARLADVAASVKDNTITWDSLKRGLNNNGGHK